MKKIFLLFTFNKFMNSTSYNFKLIYYNHINTYTNNYKNISGNKTEFIIVSQY